MTNHDFRESSVDDAIDSAVREIMQLDPRPGLRRRVLSQLDAPAASRSWLPRLVLPIGALACIALTMLVLNRGVQPTPPTPSVSAPATSRIPPSVPPAPAPSVTASAPSPVAEAAPAKVGAKPRRASTPAPGESIFGPRGRVSAASVKPANGSGAAPVLPEFAGTLPALVLPPLVIQPLNLDALPGRRIR